MDRVELSPRQQEVLDFIRDYVEEVGFPPSYREIGTALQIGSTNAVRDHLLALERKGMIQRSSSRSRGITLAPPPREEEPDFPPPLRIPLLGRIAAGTPLLAEQNIEDFLSVDPRAAGRGRHPLFALRVRGESMIEDGILDGDTLLVRVQEDAPDGSIVVVLLGEEATVKRIYREKGRVRLQPANASMRPIVIHEDEGVQPLVQGKVVAVLRFYEE